MRSLYEINEEYLKIFERMDPETGEVLITDEALDSIKEEFEEKADNIACLIKDKENMYEARKTEIDNLKKRNQSEEQQIKRLKNYLLTSMELRNRKVLKTVRNTISTRKSDSLLIEDEQLVPKEYMKEQVEVKPMKTEIKEAIKKGEDIPGCSIQERKSLIVK